MIILPGENRSRIVGPQRDSRAVPPEHSHSSGKRQVEQVDWLRMLFDNASMVNKRHILVTAGATRQKIDEVRDWGNIFTGQTGLDLALAFLEMGDVTLLTSNQQHAEMYKGRSGLKIETFRSHEDLRELLAEQMTAAVVDVVAMTAAVSDYRPEGTYRIVSKKSEGTKEVWVVEDVSAGKGKSHFDEIAVRGVRTEKLVDLFRGTWNFKGVLIKFKLEVGISEEELVKIASASRTVSGADLMVANTLTMAKPTTGEGAAYLIDDVSRTKVGRKKLAKQVVEWVRKRC